MNVNDPGPWACDTCKVPVDGWKTQRCQQDGTVIDTLCMNCDADRRAEEFRKDGVLSTSLIETAALDNVSLAPYLPEDVRAQVLASAEHIQPEIELFEAEVWFGGMQTYAQKSSFKGTRFDAEGVSILCFTMCGRAMMTLRGETGDAGPSLSTITVEDEPPRSPEECARRGRGLMGLRSIDATEAEAIALLRRARAAWGDREKTGAHMVDDRKVTLALPGMGGGSDDGDDGDDDSNEVASAIQ